MRNIVVASKKPAKWGQPWSQEDLHYLSDNYGLKADEEIAKHLGRSVLSISITARGRVHIRLTDNFYTAKELSRILGIGSTARIIRWVRKGWLKGGRYRYLWRFLAEDITECLRQHPWLVATKMRVRRNSFWWQPEYGSFLLPDHRAVVLNLKSMEPHYFRSVVRDEWERDPWYTTTQAAPLLGATPSSVLKLICKELLPAGRHGNGTYIIRQSSIREFIANDPRKRHRHDVMSESRKRRLREEGRPTRVGMLWRFVCPGCGREVKIMAPPEMMGPEVREKFIAVYVNGTCFHNAAVALPIPS